MKQFKILLTVVLSFLSIQLIAQSTVSGSVSDENGVPLPGASIVVLETNNGVTTDFDGAFSIDASEGNTISIQFVGYIAQEILVNQGSNYNIILQPDSLSEVVVVALGLSREKKSLGYAVTEVNGDEVNTIKDHNLANALVGKVAGLNITQSGFVGAASRITLRGNNSLTGNSQALIVVDGIPINADGIETGDNVYKSKVTGGGLTDINPNDVDLFPCLKGLTHLHFMVLGLVMVLY